VRLRKFIKYKKEKNSIMASFTFISLVAGIVSIFAIALSINIFNKVFQEDYKKPWLFIGISSIFMAISQLIYFLTGFGFFIINSSITEVITQILEFISITILTYGLALEYLMLKYYKGKFVKIKFIPVQEGTLGGELDINVSNGSSYVAIKKDKKFITEEFSKATKKGFEGFLITENNPKEIRIKYKLEKTPIGWISQLDSDTNSDYLKQSLDENSDIIDPLQLNNLISFIDNFLEQSQNPFICIDLNLILRVNNHEIVFEFLRYITNKINKYNGILICMINVDILEKGEEEEIKEFLRELE